MARRGRRAFWQGAALALLVLAASCRTTREAGPAPLVSASGRGAPSVAAPSLASPSSQAELGLPPALPALDLGSDFVTLAVPGFREALVSVPALQQQPPSVIVALHGNFDRPEWQCETWRRVTKASPWIVCPRGIPRRDAPKALDRWEWSSLAATKAEILASLGALQTRFPDHVDRHRRPVLIGFSLGAILGARLLGDPDLGVQSAVLIEGGYQGWTKAAAERANHAGLDGVLFAYGQTECRNAVRRLGPVLERAGLRFVAVEDVKAGHDYSGALADKIREQLPQFLRDSADRAASPVPFR